MSEIHQIWKILLDKSFYEKHKDTIPNASFDEIGQSLLPTLHEAHKKFQRDLNVSDIYHYHNALHATLTTATKNSIGAYLENIEQEPSINADVAASVYATLWRKETGRVIAEYGIRLADGEHKGVEGLLDYASKVSTSLVPKDFDEPVDTDPISMFNKLKDVGKWHLGLPTLDVKVGKVSPGMFITLLGRPDCGKSALIVDMIAGKNGFAVQNANTHVICNEEAALRTAGRMACCYNQINIHEAMKNPSLVKTEGWDKIRKNITLVHKPDMNVHQLETYIRTHRPEVLVLDQIDHIQIEGTYEKGHERLGILYRRVRELCSLYNLLVIAVTQASAEAEGHSIVTYAMAEGSRTSKAATADLIIGIGKADKEEGDVVLRYLTCSKNKISGFKGTAVVQLIQSQSRFIA